jgi:hypothetical protein
MEKSTLVNYLLYGYDSSMNSKTLAELNAELHVFEIENIDLSIDEFTRKLKTNFPQLDLIHDCFIRSKTSKIESHLKTIIIILVILSIISAVVTIAGGATV